MSARRISEKVFTVPAGASFLDFQRSDGDPRTWPTNTTSVVDNDGHVNFMQHVEVQSSVAVRWRVTVGQAAAIALELPKGPEYVLRDWPEGYRLFDHHKGPEDNPRHDLYLFGPPGRRFRSINEFVPHAIWLLKDPNTDSSTCLCKYCSKKTQKEVTASLPGILRGPSNTQSPTPSRPKPFRDRTRAIDQERSREPKIYAAVQKAPNPIVVPQSTNVARQTMLVERNSDLRAVHSKTGMRLTRWFRAGELLWCALDPPIIGPNVAITFWPGIVDEIRLKTKPIPIDPTLTNALDPGDIDPQTTWRVEQSTVYKMQLLAVAHSILLNDTQVIPYQSHMPPHELISEMSAFPPEKLDFNREKLAGFNPHPEGEPANFSDAIAPYALAVQIGATISDYWSPTDEWAFEYTAPISNPPTPPAPKTAGPSSLQAAIEAASSHNSKSNALPPSQPSTNVSTPEFPRVSDRLIGRPAPSYTQIRFQGIWWGAERIWVDEFVRVKLLRRSLAPKGAENILPPSGPGKASLAEWLAKGLDPSELGAGSRGVFMRLDGLYIVETPQAGGQTKKECRASGMLYELADEDWEEPVVDPTEATTTQSSQAQVTNLSPPNNQLSRPSSPHYPLPAAPAGYRFRQILPDGYEAILSLNLISGRYYPRILSHPLLSPILVEVMSAPESSGLAEHDNLWTLEGLSGGYRNSVDPTQHKSSRIKMIEDADKIATSELEAHRLAQLAEAVNDTIELDSDLVYPDSMDVDAGPS